MSYPPLSAAGGSLAVAARPLRDGAVVTAAVALALLALYAVFLDQGHLLSPVLGKVATSANYLHEFAHDGRHLLGAPCH
ncbi:CbtB-domain containing protein [Streptomyces sp. NPDC004658]|uniref:CbtB domain-containing protein n=1 Tax=Streptomyces sp. NPDC004658 TaxID=3154672 RepID=UPI0033BEA34F